MDCRGPRRAAVPQDLTPWAFAYRSSTRLARGLRINLSKSVATFTAGRGATLNLGKRGMASPCPAVHALRGLCRRDGLNGAYLP
jgi:hypothetical protein